MDAPKITLEQRAFGLLIETVPIRFERSRWWAGLCTFKRERWRAKRFDIAEDHDVAPIHDGVCRRCALPK